MTSSRPRLSRVMALGALVLAACGDSALGPGTDCPWRIGDVCGEWLLVRTSGGWSPPPVMGDTWLLLRADSTFAVHEADEELAGVYRISRYDGPQNLWSDSIWVVDFDLEADTLPTIRQRVQLRGSDTLQLNDLFYDGYQYDYERGHR